MTTLIVGIPNKNSDLSYPNLFSVKSAGNEIDDHIIYNSNISPPKHYKNSSKGPQITDIVGDNSLFMLDIAPLTSLWA